MRQSQVAGHHAIMRRKTNSYVILPLIVLIATSSSFGRAAESTNGTLPFVSPIFGDNMVLQRGKLNTIWGWSSPGDKVKIRLPIRVRVGLRGGMVAGR